MELVIYGFIISVIIHFIYILYIIGIGYKKTKLNKPDISKVDRLPTKVEHGKAISPFFFVFSLVGIGIICWFILFLYINIFN